MRFVTEYYSSPSNGGKHFDISINAVVRICDKLSDADLIARLWAGSQVTGNGNYACVLREPQYIEHCVHECSAVAYGFPYIYDYFSNYVLPIVVETDNGQEIGTVFRFLVVW